MNCIKETLSNIHSANITIILKDDQGSVSGEIISTDDSSVLLTNSQRVDYVNIQKIKINVDEPIEVFISKSLHHFLFNKKWCRDKKFNIDFIIKMFVYTLNIKNKKVNVDQKLKQFLSTNPSFYPLDQQEINVTSEVIQKMLVPHFKETSMCDECEYIYLTLTQCVKRLLNTDVSKFVPKKCINILQKTLQILSQNVNEKSVKKSSEIVTATLDYIYDIFFENENKITIKNDEYILYNEVVTTFMEVYKEYYTIY